MEDKIILKMTKLQAETISSACELMSRLYTGQLEELQRLFWRPQWSKLKTERIAKLIQQLKRECLEELDSPSSYYGITSAEIPEIARVSYDLHQVIRHRLAGLKPPGSASFICYDPPMRTSSYAGENLAEILEL